MPQSAFAFELSKAKWKLGVLLPGSKKLSRYNDRGRGCDDGGGAVGQDTRDGGAWRNASTLTSRPQPHIQGRVIGGFNMIRTTEILVQLDFVE